MKFSAFTSQNTSKFVVNSHEFTKFTRYHLSATYWHLLVCISQNPASVAGSGEFFSIQIMYFFTVTLYYMPTIFSLSSVPPNGVLHLRFVCAHDLVTTTSIQRFGSQKKCLDCFYVPENIFRDPDRSFCWCVVASRPHEPSVCV